MTVTGHRTEQATPVIWLDAQGEPLACAEKIKVLTENLAELSEIAQEAFEDALLMGADEAQARQVLSNIITRLANPYAR